MAATTIGVLALQGAFTAHSASFREVGLKVREIRRVADLEGLGGLMIPGGESTTLLNLMGDEPWFEGLRRFHDEGGVLAGTCAGAILLSREVRPRQPSLALLDAIIERNAFGRQVDSFEAAVDAPALGGPVDGVFIRAPRFHALWPEVDVLGRLRGEPVLVRQGRVIAATFHPELTEGLAFHRYVGELARKTKGARPAPRRLAKRPPPPPPPPSPPPLLHSLPMRPLLTQRLAPFGTSVFAEMTALAIEHDAINLGQGFPDFDGPAFVMDAAMAAMRDGHNQYAPMPGVPELRGAVADHQRRFYGLAHDPATEVTVHAGATGALAATLQALLDPGDEAIIFEPYYDAYRPGISLAGASERVVRLTPPDFTFDPAELEAAVGPKTRLLLWNSPNNPAGKVFSRVEVEIIADVCVRHDLLAVTDEVYEHIVFEGEHIPLATLPGMRERTVTISSAGKTFSFTGWKIGWTCAAPPLAAAVRAAHQFITYAVATPFQHAMAAALKAPDDYYRELCEGYRSRRDHLCAGLADIGFDVATPSGTYFANADIRPLGFDDDVEFCRMIPERVGVAAVPLSAFLLEGGPRHMVRFAFPKDVSTLDEAVRRLRRLRGLRTA